MDTEAILDNSDTPEDRAALVLELNVSPEAEREVEHLLTQFADILPDNPRVMKRMVNAFAMRQAIGMLERNAILPAVLARWTILEQRFPGLADLLIEHPEWIQFLSAEAEGGQQDLPSLLALFVGSEAVRSIVAEGSPHGLTVDNVRAITRGSAS